MTARQRFDVYDLADRVILQFIFMPILRNEIQSYVKTHNDARIRYQGQRMNHIAGRPNELYSHFPSKYGFTPDPEVLQELKTLVGSYGKWLKKR